MGMVENDRIIYGGGQVRRRICLTKGTEPIDRQRQMRWRNYMAETGAEEMLNDIDVGF